MKQLFFIRNLEISTENRNNQRKHSHSHHEIVYCHEGEGYQLSTGEEQKIRKGTLILYPAGQSHSIYCWKDQHCMVYQIYLDQELFASSVNVEKDALYVLGQLKVYSRQRSLINLSNIGSERIDKICGSILWEFQNRFRGYSWAIKHKLIELLITVVRDSKFKVPLKGNMGTPLSNSHIQDVCMYMQSDYMNPITVEDVLQFCPLSRSHFHALFKKETGKTFVQYLNNLRCRKACERLIGTDNSILEISLECGFNNISHFCHTFRDYLGMSPREYRRMNTEIPEEADVPLPVTE